MSSTFSCDSCGARYKRGSLEAGKKVKCAKCGAVITIPEEELAELPELEDIEAVEAAAPADGAADLAAGEDEGDEVEAPRSSRAGGRVGAREGGAAGRRAGRAGAREGGAAGRRAGRAGAREGGAAGGRAGRAAGTAAGSGGRRGRAEPEPRSKTPMLIGLGVVVVAAIAVVFATMGKGDKDEGDGGTGGGNGQKEQTPAEVVKTPRQKFDEAMADADKAADKSTKVARLEEAVHLLSVYAFADADVTTKDLYEKLVAVEPDHAAARKELGYYRYDGRYEKYAGQWLTKDEIAKANQEYREFAAAEEARKAAEAEKARWDKDAWTKKCARVRDHFVKDVSPVPDFELVFFFDMPEVPRPYFLMIEKTENPSPEASAKDYGPGLATLRETFARAYNNGILADWDETARVVPILMFASRQSYYKYRDNGHEDLPKSDFIGAFYKHVAPEGMEELFRGCLYVWQGENAKEFTSTLFHEATHQLMHNGCQDAKMADSPWLEEGMAEYWSGYDGNKYAGFKFGRLQDGRWRNCQQIAENFYQNKNGAETFVMTPKDLLNYSNAMFNADRSGLNGGIGSTRVALTYALGWGFIHFCYNYEPRDAPGTHPYRQAFENMLKDELRYQLTPAKAVEYMGIKDDAGWDELAEDYFFYIKRTLRGMKGKEYHPGGNGDDKGDEDKGDGGDDDKGGGER